MAKGAVGKQRKARHVDGRTEVGWRALPRRPSLFAMKPEWTPVHSRMNQLRKWQLLAKRIRERQIATNALAVGEQCGNEPDAVVGIDVKECAICMEAICGHEFCAGCTERVLNCGAKPRCPLCRAPAPESDHPAVDEPHPFRRRLSSWLRDAGERLMHGA